MITLNWKSFNVNVSRLRDKLKTLLSSNFDGIVCDQESLTIMFVSPPTEAEIETVTNYWNNLTEADLALTPIEIATSRLNDAISFGSVLRREISAENIAMGITVYNKTTEVSDYLDKAQRYLREGSLYAVIREIDSLVAAGVPSDLSPFVTEARLLATKQKIQTFLGIS